MKVQINQYHTNDLVYFDYRTPCLGEPMCNGVRVLFLYYIQTFARMVYATMEFVIVLELIIFLSAVPNRVEQQRRPSLVPPQE